MSIVDKHGALSRMPFVPVFCDSCGQASELTCVSEQTRNALIQMGNYRELRRELELLERTERLFARFPNSRHRLVAEHLHLRPNEVPTTADEAFERALGEDAELREFLTHCGFLLTARLEFVRTSVASYTNWQHFLIPCPTCGAGILCLEREFFEHLR